MTTRALRTLVVMATALGLACTPWASAGTATVSGTTKVFCHLLKDPVGDTDSVAPDDNSELDLVGGDIATTRTRLTAVIRLNHLTQEDIMEPAGRIWEFDFTANGKNFMLMAALLPGGHEYGAYISDTRFEKGKSGARAATGIGELDGSLDLKHREVHLSGPLSIFTKYASFNQTYVDHLVMFSYRAHGESTRALPTGSVVDISMSMGVGVDQSWSTKKYVPRAPSCVQVGH